MSGDNTQIYLTYTAIPESNMPAVIGVFSVLVYDASSVKKYVGTECPHDNLGLQVPATDLLGRRPWHR